MEAAHLSEVDNLISGDSATDIDRSSVAASADVTELVNIKSRVAIGCRGVAALALEERREEVSD